MLRYAQIVSYGITYYRPGDRQIMSPITPNGSGTDMWTSHPAVAWLWSAAGEVAA
jgi:hypothetical protein